jgi:cell division protein FtsI/penicillin-binding protein 2
MASARVTARGSRRRIQLLVLCAVAIFGLLAARATWLGAIRSSSLSAKADLQHLITVDLPASRGAILSADGQALAVDRPTMLITADARYVRDPAALAETITSVTRGDAERRARLEADLRGRNAYVILAKHVPIKEAEYLRKLDLDGVHFTRTSARKYPLDKVAGQVLGLTDIESGKGIDGLERLQNDALAGRHGTRTEIRDPRLGETVRIQDMRSPQPGKTVTLTINAAIQERMELVLAGARKAYKAKTATGVIMDPATGAIIAMATVPRVNPNDRARLDPKTTRNRAVTDPFEPGSVFKVITVAGALEEGLTTPSTAYSLEPNLTYAKGTTDQFTIQEAHKRTDWETMTTTEILQRSSNIGTIRLSSLLRKKNLLRPWMAKFGFGARTGVDVAGEDSGDLPPREKWNLASRVNIPFGQGMTATQLQLVRAYAAIANGGYLVRPHVIASIGGVPAAARDRTRIISPRTAHQLTRILEKVVEGRDGTGVEASLEEYSVAGKTGTAEKVDPERGVYVDRYRGSFIGFVPSNKPRLVIAVMIDDPDPLGPHTGGEVAAPAFKQIADHALSTLSIPPN